MSCIWTFVCHDHSGKFHSRSSSYFIYTFRQGVTCTTCSKQHFSSCVPSSSLFHLFASVWRARTYQLVFSPLFIVWHSTYLLCKSTGVYLWVCTSSNWIKRCICSHFFVERLHSEMVCFRELVIFTKTSGGPCILKKSICQSNNCCSRRIIII